MVAVLQSSSVEPLPERRPADVLVAEDDPDLRRLIARVLENAGYTVTCAVDGAAALKQALEGRPDLVVLDVSMPERDGYDVCRALQAEMTTAAVPAVIFLSAHGETEARVIGLESGAVDYTVKPFVPAELKARVAAALRTKASRDTFAAQASIDAQTGLANRRQLDERAAEATGLTDRHGLELACLLVDVDHFKRVNDTYGHPVGDQVLREVARRIRFTCRATDLPARYGGEEFAVLLPGADAAGALAAAEKVRAAIAASPVCLEDGTEIEVRASVGAAVWSATMRSAGDLFAAADAGLYDAKHQGRNCVVLHAPDRAPA